MLRWYMTCIERYEEACAEAGHLIRRLGPEYALCEAHRRLRRATSAPPRHPANDEPGVARRDEADFWQRVVERIERLHPGDASEPARRQSL